jgi:hypothetical protein
MPEIADDESPDFRRPGQACRHVVAEGCVSLGKGASPIPKDFARVRPEQPQTHVAARSPVSEVVRQPFVAFFKSFQIKSFVIGLVTFQQRKMTRIHLKARMRTALWWDLPFWRWDW